MAHDFLVVGLGASAGGIPAFKSFFSAITPDSGMAYVVVLHLSPEHDSQLAQVLQVASPIPVSTVVDDTVVEPNHVYVIPPSRTLSMVDGALRLGPMTRLDQRRAPIDHFLRSLAEAVDGRACAIILSGTGADGSSGLKRIKEHGGLCLAQDPSEAEQADMPSNAIATGQVDDVLPAAALPARLAGYRDAMRAIRVDDRDDDGGADARALREIFTLLRARTGHDFSNYKRSTISRRIARRLGVNEILDLPVYVRYLREHPEESQALLKELLISVTNFFRDATAFETLERKVIPRLFDGKTEEDAVRVWVPGCATGEEAYSIAMLLAEFGADRLGFPSIQVFATDIDQHALAVAREGLYNVADASDVPPERLQRYFSRHGEQYRVRKELRDLVLFAHHNVLKDPPFLHLDLVSCRNLLIYLNRPAQQRVLEVMAFALSPGGYLFVGPSESIEGAGDLFVGLDSDAQIFQSRAVIARPAIPVVDVPSVPRSDPRTAAERPERRPRERQSFPDLHQRLLEQYAPPSVVVNENHDIVHLSEQAGRYLHFAGGEPSNDLLRAVRQDLRLDLRTALYESAQTLTPVDTRPLPVTIGDRAVTVQISVRPVVRDGDPARGFFLVLFQESTDGLNVGSPPASLTSVEPARQLEEEVIRLKSQLRATVEQHETQAEELKAANEELQAMNEELRSAAEELETSKEELQSVNEELTTVNQALTTKIEEQVQANNDTQNLINSTDIGVVFLDRSCRIKLFTPRARDVFSLIPADRGRPLTDISSLLNEPDLYDDVVHVLDRLDRVEREVSTRDGRWHLMRVFPYRTAEDRIEGVILTFVDITERRRAEHLKQVNDSLEERVRDRTRELEAVNASLDLQLAERQAAEDRVRRLLNRLVTVQEDERRRVARDLHDHLGQQMSALRFKLSSLPESGDETYRATRDEAQRLLDRLDRDLDFLTWQLRPALLDDLGLKPALARFVEEWSTSGGVQVELEASRLPDQRYDPQVETHLYRIVQEALNNVLKHARASHVGIVLERREGQLTALIEDDGQGFDLAGVDASPEQRGLGLVGMRERAALVGGVVEVETAPGKGTTVFVRMPVA